MLLGSSFVWSTDHDVQSAVAKYIRYAVLQGHWIFSRKLQHSKLRSLIIVLNVVLGSREAFVRVSTIGPADAGTTCLTTNQTMSSPRAATLGEVRNRIDKRERKIGQNIISSACKIGGKQKERMCSGCGFVICRQQCVVSVCLQFYLTTLSQWL